MTIETQPAIIYLVRHGETIGNIQKVLYSQDKDVLSDTGKAETEQLGKHLKDVKFTRVYSSPYSRTRETSSIILSTNLHEKPEVKFDDRLREISLGKLEGIDKGYITLLGTLTKHIMDKKPLGDFHFEGGETTIDVKARVKPFLHELYNELNATSIPETILIVAHGALDHCFMDLLKECDEFEVVNWDESVKKIMRNTTYHKFTIGRMGDNGKMSVELLEKHFAGHLGGFREDSALKKLADSPEGQAMSGCFQV